MHYFTVVETAPIATVLHLTGDGIIEIIAFRNQIIRIIGNLEGKKGNENTSVMNKKITKLSNINNFKGKAKIKFIMNVFLGVWK